MNTSINQQRKLSYLSFKVSFKNNKHFEIFTHQHKSFNIFIKLLKYIFQ